jgi:hypothetical protein
MTAHLEHANYTVSDPLKTAAWMEKLFGWHIRWQGAALGGGFTVHVGSDVHYLALYTPAGSITLRWWCRIWMPAKPRSNPMVSKPATTATMNPDGGFISTMTTASNMRLCNIHNG